MNVHICACVDICFYVCICMHEHVSICLFHKSICKLCVTSDVQKECLCMYFSSASTFSTLICDIINLANNYALLTLLG